jgi:hypothetical protein
MRRARVVAPITHTPLGRTFHSHECFLDPATRRCTRPKGDVSVQRRRSLSPNPLLAPDVHEAGLPGKAQAARSRDRPCGTGSGTRRGSPVAVHLHVEELHLAAELQVEDLHVAALELVELRLRYHVEIRRCRRASTSMLSRRSVQRIQSSSSSLARG